MHSHSVDRRVLSGVGVQAPWHGGLETVWLLCDKAQQVGCLQEQESCALVRDAGRCEHCGTRQERSTLLLSGQC